MIALYESVPYDPTIRASNYYMNNWLYVYRYEKNDKSTVISKMVAKAKEMAKHGYDYNYVNPSFGAKDWCCVTVVSYWVCVGTGKEWKMGDPNQSYLWSPRYGGEYDLFMFEQGFSKYNFDSIAELKEGDIIQSRGHVALCFEKGGFDLSKMPTLKYGSKGNVVKNLQCLLNLWMCQSGANKPLLVDGDFGYMTEERLKLYQEVQGLYVDGVCGGQTWEDILLA